MSADLALLQKYAATRDGEALAAVVRQHQGLVYGTCLRILGNIADAEDAAQECFLKLVRHAGAVRSSPAGWLHRCATHVSLNALKRTGARQRRERVYGRARDARAGGTETWREIAPHIDRALDELEPEVRYVLIQCYLAQRPRTEVARELGVSRVTLYRRLNDGTKLMQRKLRTAGVVAPVAMLVVLLEENGAVAAPPALAAELGGIVSAFSQGPAEAPAGEPAAGGHVGTRAGRVSAWRSVAAALGLLLTGVLIVGVWRALSAPTAAAPKEPPAAWAPAAPRVAAPRVATAPARRGAAPAAPSAKEIEALANAVAAVVDRSAEPNAPAPPPAPAGDDDESQWHPFWITPARAKPAPAKARPAPRAARPRPHRRRRRAKPTGPSRRSTSSSSAGGSSAANGPPRTAPDGSPTPGGRRRRARPAGINFTVSNGKVSNGQIITKSRTRVRGPFPLVVGGARSGATRLRR